MGEREEEEEKVCDGRENGNEIENWPMSFFFFFRNCCNDELLERRRRNKGLRGKEESASFKAPAPALRIGNGLGTGRECVFPLLPASIGLPQRSS